MEDIKTENKGNSSAKMEDIKTENEGNSSAKMEDIKTENEGNSSAKMEDIKTENEGNSSAESIIISESDNDSDYEPAPKKKAVARKAAKPATKKPAKKKVEKPPKVKKTPVKRKRVATKTTKTASKKAKIEKNLENETLPENSAFVDSESCFSGQNDIHSSDTFDQLVPSVNYNTAKIVENAKKFHTPWKDEVVIAEVTDIPIDVAKNIISLFEQECTIPFIVRYRKEKTGGLQAEKLRDIQAAYDEVKLVHKKVENILKTVKSEKFDEAAATSLLSAKTLEEVEFLYAPFKPGSKRTLAERSKQLGLEPLAQQLLEAKISLPGINFSNYIKPQKGLKDVTEIKTGIQYIIADVISKDRRVLDFVRSMSNHRQIRIISSKAPSAEKKDKQAFVAGETTDNFKYENYFNLNIPVKFVAHHQVMAVNRGEKKKVLTVKIEIPFDMQRKIKDFIWHNFFGRRYFPEPETPEFLQSCVKDSYERLIEPHLCRQIRSDLTKKAEKESIAVFCSNVRSLLLTPPVRGKTVIGVDPGFSHGCKIAVLSSKGDVLKTDVIYPFRKKNDFDATKLKEMISSYGVEIIAIGNGTACRETEKWLSNLITLKFFSPFEIKYCIVNESGVSIYSVTKEAEAELPNMDANLRSAAAIGRRLQDPLLEYVKIEPKHLGVGMYQHDIPEAQLKKALDGVVEECVSFVGVDLNVCPEFLLKKISGLNATKAKHIVEWRNQHGSFINRQQLLDIKGLGPKSFEQCAGFVKILPETSTGAVKAESGTKGKKNTKYTPNPLDRTIVHPESYEVAERFLKELSADPGDVGMQMLVDKVNNYMKFRSTGDVAKSFNVPVPVMQLIIDAFKQLLDYDIRAEFDQPLFKTSVRKLTDLKAGQELSGRVMNVTSFGAFVDIGVEKDGLIHVSKMFGQTLSVGERVTVKVLEVQIQKSRITLQLLNKQPK